MNKSFLKKIKMFYIMYNSIINLPTPINISIWWNFGSLLGVSLLTQILTGLFLSMHYCPSNMLAFNSMIHIIQDINFGWLFRLMHMNGASLFFFCMFCHIGRGIYYHSYKLVNVWIIGTLMFLISMATAFMGYVLPWGQMSFWGATVITNLISTIPYIGKMGVEWIWGGFSVESPTLNRFFTLHFIMPFIILMMMMIHLMFIHETGSNNPLGLNSNLYMIKFHPFYTLKDMIGFLIMWFILLWMISFIPFKLCDPENFIQANPMITPTHIQPEWYFLFAYTILRSIPNKLGGVLALLMSILILLILPMLPPSKMNCLTFYPINQIMFWNFLTNIIILTWLGSQLIETPFIEISIFMTITYFLFFFINNMFSLIWDLLLN